MSDGLYDPANQNANVDAPSQAAPVKRALSGQALPEKAVPGKASSAKASSAKASSSKASSGKSSSGKASSSKALSGRATPALGAPLLSGDAIRSRDASLSGDSILSSDSGPPSELGKAPAKRKRRRSRRRQSSTDTPKGDPASVATRHGKDRRERAKPARPKGGHKLDRYAALDLGTNNCRLLVAEPQDDGFRVVDAFSRIVRLGDGMAASGALGQEAMARAISALKICSRKLGENRVKKARLVATEACRFAENGAEFLANVEAKTGLQLEIVDRETEARLAVAGCSSLVHPRARGVILFDIGGGSSELVWLDLRTRQQERGFALNKFIRAWVSLPVGVVTLSEKFGGVDVTHTVFEAMVQHVSHLLTAAGAFAPLDDEFEADGFHLLGTSGTVTTLAGIHLNLRRYDRRRVDGLWMQSGDVTKMINVLVGMDYKARVGNPCIGSDRADLVLAGCAIFEAFRRRWPCVHIRVADRGLREGILIEMMSQDQVWRRRGQRRQRQRRTMERRAAATSPEASRSTPVP